MTGYWIRHRLIFTLILSGAMAAIVGLLFVFPYVSQKANNYNSQSIYKNTSIDFIVPEPSFEQVVELPGTNGIDKIFPFFLTKTAVEVNGTSRTTTVLLADQMTNADITMYNSNRIIESSSSECSNPIIVDWQFCNDTSAKIGDSVWITLDGNKTEYTINAIYESNSIYDGGAILVEITPEQKDAIMQNSKNSGYSGAYVSASDYTACRNYFTSDYRPLGRLKDRSQFDDDEQYQVHYDAIMSSSFSNEITDFRVRESSLADKNNAVMIYLGAALALIIIVAFNVVMSKRGCEKVYFTKHCIPKGQNVKPYYSTSFIIETLLMVCCSIGIVIFKIKTSSEYIPTKLFDINMLIIPCVIIMAELVSYIMNSIMVSGLAKKAKKR